MNNLPMTIMSHVDDAGLTVSQFRVLAHICRRSGKNGSCWASAKSMGEVCSINIKTVRACVKYLEKIGWIKLEKQHGKTTRITPLTLPNPIPYPNEYPTQSDTHGSTQSDTHGSTQSDTHKGIKRRYKVRDKEIMALPFDSITFKTAWLEWNNYRKEKNKSLTPTTIKLQLQSLQSMGEDMAIESINKSMAQGWSGLFPIKPDKPNQRPTNEKLKYQQNGQQFRPFD